VTGKRKSIKKIAERKGLPYGHQKWQRKGRPALLTTHERKRRRGGGFVQSRRWQHRAKKKIRRGEGKKHSLKREGTGRN